MLAAPVPSARKRLELLVVLPRPLFVPWQHMSTQTSQNETPTCANEGCIGLVATRWSLAAAHGQ
jgi:hypothetical protein